MFICIPVLLPGKSHGRRSLVGCSPWGCEASDMTELLHFHFSRLCIGEGNGNPLQCSCLENPRDGVAQSQTQLKWLSSSSSIYKITWYHLYVESKKNYTNELMYKTTKKDPQILKANGNQRRNVTRKDKLSLGLTYGCWRAGNKKDIWLTSNLVHNSETHRRVTGP